MGIIVQNRRNGAILSAHVDIVFSVIGRSRGLMFSFRPRTLVMRFSSPRIISLHMFFVFYPIDVIWLAEDGRIVEALGGFRPFSFYTPRKKAVTVVEMPAGTIRKSGTRVGDRIRFSP